MKTLVINCGSSSLKYQLIDMSNEESMVQGLVERIGIEGSALTQKTPGKGKHVINTEIKDHKDAIKLVDSKEESKSLFSFFNFIRYLSS